MSITQMNTMQRKERQPGMQRDLAPGVSKPTPMSAGAFSLQKGIGQARTAARVSELQKTVAGNIGTNRNIAAEILPAIGQPRTAENVASVRQMADDRAAKTQLPAFKQYANDDVQQMARAYTATPGWRDGVDYAAQIQQLAMLPPTAENQQAMRNAMSARAAKIAAGGEAMAQYADDDVQKMAQQYLKQYAPQNADLTGYYDRADALAEQNYTEADKLLRAQHEAQLKATRDSFDASRRAADLAYAVKSRGQENLLAEQGIGRGLGAAPSSGYSETARAGALADYANGINQTYTDQAAAERELAISLAAARLQAAQERNAAQQQNLYARAQQANADREHGFSAHQFNAGLDQYYEGMDYQRGRDAVLDKRDERDFTEGVRQFDKSFDRGVLESDRNYEEGVRQFDKSFDRGVLESDRNFAADQYWNGKDYELAYYNAHKASAPKSSYTPAEYNLDDYDAMLAQEDEETLPPVSNPNFWYTEQ